MSGLRYAREEQGRGLLWLYLSRFCALGRNVWWGGGWGRRVVSLCGAVLLVDKSTHMVTGSGS